MFALKVCICAGTTYKVIPINELVILFFQRYDHYDKWKSLLSSAVSMQSVNTSYHGAYKLNAPMLSIIFVERTSRAHFNVIHKSYAFNL